jgi:hypothetical protein
MKPQVAFSYGSSRAKVCPDEVRDVQHGNDERQRDEDASDDVHDGHEDDEEHDDAHGHDDGKNDDDQEVGRLPPRPVLAGRAFPFRESNQSP